MVWITRHYDARPTIHGATLRHYGREATESVAFQPNSELLCTERVPCTDHRRGGGRARVRWGDRGLELPLRMETTAREKAQTEHVAEYFRNLK